ncbi:unnamed protein product [Prorocentrum cordatum]|uniref:Uncharacterized protein n=1 Tax=Prorocentrum cordatum TaxID=2364126 RepID=A0ABN9UA88_9DINO|nr:unnamed protein product [Polarella glacialis]
MERPPRAPAPEAAGAPPRRDASSGETQHEPRPARGRAHLGGPPARAARPGARAREVPARPGRPASGPTTPLRGPEGRPSSSEAGTEPRPPPGGSVFGASAGGGGGHVSQA